MSNDIVLKNGLIIPEHELEITTSRAGGPGGQHVNKTDSRITVRWNVKTTSVLNEYQKELIQTKLSSRLTTEGDLIIHNSESRSQLQNRKNALANLAHEIDNALKIPKKRKATRPSKSAKEARLESKTRHGEIKKMRSKKIHID
ncbi:MAG: alternative ribosome rescue aminoacyl-tRNA hydrolase ArfB [Candidatus Babeliales bacterium]|nr:alternative ribosome rescue aminoacyl-tRNA hydrolase ArfB [Candidatus Babeliales bacterium]